MYNFMLVQNNGSFSYSISNGTLPDGVNLDSGSVLLSGTPTENGSFDFSITASDGVNSVVTDYTLEILPPFDTTPRDPGYIKGYLPGGASGGILPASMSDIPLDFDTLNQYGCFIGSAAIVILRARRVGTA